MGIPDVLQATGKPRSAWAVIRTALVGEFVEEIEDFGPLQNDTPVTGSTESR